MVKRKVNILWHGLNLYVICFSSWSVLGFALEGWVVLRRLLISCGSGWNNFQCNLFSSPDVTKILNVLTVASLVCRWVEEQQYKRRYYWLFFNVQVLVLSLELFSACQLDLDIINDQSFLIEDVDAKRCGDMNLKYFHGYCGVWNGEGWF